MKRYIARQPIFNRDLTVSAYELLYRDGDKNSANILDGDQATRSVLSDAIVVFGLQNLTNNRLAYINFTEHLLMDDFVFLADPKRVMIEILETIEISAPLVARLEELCRRGYRLALDDYTGDKKFDPILPMVDVLKVDFLLTDVPTQARIAERFRRSKVTLLAEKVEDQETFQRAVQQGYRLFQGFFFERPTSIEKETPPANQSNVIRLLRELSKPDFDLSKCAAIIRADAALTYQLLRKVHTLRYYRGNSIQMVQQALVLLGWDELQHWAALVLALGMNRTRSEESVREAYIRGLFTELLVERSEYASRKSDGFLMGMFSMMEFIMNQPMSEILRDVPLAEDVKAALMRTERDFFTRVLDFVKAYESGAEEELPALDLKVEPEEITRLYMQSIQEADQAFEDD